MELSQALSICSNYNTADIWCHCGDQLFRCLVGSVKYKKKTQQIKVDQDKCYVSTNEKLRFFVCKLKKGANYSGWDLICCFMYRLIYKIPAANEKKKKD